MFDGELKGKMKVIINLIKFTEVYDNAIFKVVEIEEDDDQWIWFAKEKT